MSATGSVVHLEGSTHLSRVVVDGAALEHDRNGAGGSFCSRSGPAVDTDLDASEACSKSEGASRHHASVEEAKLSLKASTVRENLRRRERKCRSIRGRDVGMREGEILARVHGLAVLRHGAVECCWDRRRKNRRVGRSSLSSDYDVRFLNAVKHGHTSHIGIAVDVIFSIANYVK